MGPHHIALVGGFRVNILSALNILVFSIHENQWVSEQVALKQARHHCHACFTNEHLYIFSGTVDGPEDIDFNFARTIERVEVNDLLKQKVKETEEIKIELSSPTRAGILVPGDTEDGEQLLMLVMPVMLNH